MSEPAASYVPIGNDPDDFSQRVAEIRRAMYTSPADEPTSPDALVNEWRVRARANSQAADAERQGSPKARACSARALAYFNAANELARALGLPTTSHVRSDA